MKQYIFAVKHVSAKRDSDGCVLNETIGSCYDRFFSNIDAAEKYRSLLEDAYEVSSSSSSSGLNSFSVELIELYS